MQLFDETWCISTPVSTDEALPYTDHSALGWLNYTAISTFTTTAAERVPTRVIFAPWTLLFSGLEGLPESAFFAACYPSADDWHESVARIFSMLEPSSYAQVRRTTGYGEPGDSPSTDLVDYMCTAPTPIGVTFCGSRCLQGTRLDHLSCQFADGLQNFISCSCCSPGPRSLDPGPQYICTQCCSDGVPRSQGWNASAPSEDAWARSAHLWDQPDVAAIWRWVHPLLTCVYIFVILMTFSKLTPVANAISVLIFGAFLSGITSFNVALVLEIALVLVADSRLTGLRAGCTFDGRCDF
jgi:hypothetical protein